MNQFSKLFTCDLCHTEAKNKPLETVKFVAGGQYQLPEGHNPLPTGLKGRLVALKWLLTGQRPSVEGYVSKPQTLVVSCVGAGGSGGVK